MPQLQLPIFPAGVTEINSQIAVQKEAGRVCYIHGHLPVFQHEVQDVRSFRMLTSQMIDTGTVKPKETPRTEPAMPAAKGRRPTARRAAWNAWRRPWENWSRRRSSFRQPATSHKAECCWRCQPCWRQDCCAACRSSTNCPTDFTA